MCAINAALAFASMALTAYAGYEQAEGQKDMAQYQQQVSEQNASLDEFRAQQAATIGSVQEEQHRAKVRQLAGSQRADFAARGIDLQSGVVQDMVDETYTMGETDALTIRFNAMNEAWGYRTQAVNSRNDAKMARFGGKQARRNTYLTTAANLGSQGYSYYRDGAFKFGGGGG